MRKQFFALLLVTSLSSANTDSQVFVCMNGSTSVYHVSEKCGALNRCSHKIKKMSVPEAKEKGLRACRVCH